MTPEAQRIAIAEACGWTNIRQTAPERGSLAPRFFGYNGKHNITRIIPDYLSSLDAMHEAEKVLPKENRYAEYLVSVCGTMNWKLILSATASQRAEAFLKTLNLWKDS